MIFLSATGEVATVGNAPPHRIVAEDCGHKTAEEVRCVDDLAAREAEQPKARMVLVVLRALEERTGEAGQETPEDLGARAVVRLRRHRGHLSGGADATLPDNARVDTMGRQEGLDALIGAFAGPLLGRNTVAGQEEKSSDEVEDRVGADGLEAVRRRHLAGAHRLRGRRLGRVPGRRGAAAGFSSPLLLCCVLDLLVFSSVTFPSSTAATGDALASSWPPVGLSAGKPPGLHRMSWTIASSVSSRRKGTMRVRRRIDVLARVAMVGGRLPPSSSALRQTEDMVSTILWRKTWGFSGRFCLSCRICSGPMISKTSSTDMGAAKRSSQNSRSSAGTSSIKSRLIPSTNDPWLSEFPIARPCLATAATAPASGDPCLPFE